MIRVSSWTTRSSTHATAGMLRWLCSFIIILRHQSIFTGDMQMSDRSDAQRPGRQRVDWMYGKFDGERFYRVGVCPDLYSMSRGTVRVLYTVYFLVIGISDQTINWWTIRQMIRRSINWLVENLFERCRSIVYTTVHNIQYSRGTSVFSLNNVNTKWFKIPLTGSYGECTENTTVVRRMWEKWTTKKERQKEIQKDRIKERKREARKKESEKERKMNERKEEMMKERK